MTRYVELCDCQVLRWRSLGICLRPCQNRAQVISIEQYAGVEDHVPGGSSQVFATVPIPRLEWEERMTSSQ
ncbi:hypothetical protein M758_UG083200 [Ceratodon purpureus]|nr:hypothetical protein M758_UG083200 [Ceratodon purpureus]